jgi:outer membrane protein assembly factor BamA
LAELVPGVLVGDPSRQFPVRGFEPGVQRGSQVVSASAEYRAPLALITRGLGLLPLFADRLSMTAFGDAGRAWCSGTVRGTPGAAGLCLPPSVRDGWLASAGAELALDLGVQWDVPYRVRMGVAQPVVRPSDVARQTSFYFTLGSSF